MEDASPLESGNEAPGLGSAEIAEPLPAWVALPANDVALKIRSGQGNTAFFQDLAAVLAAVQHVAESPSAQPFCHSRDCQVSAPVRSWSGNQGGPAVDHSRGGPAKVYMTVP